MFERRCDAQALGGLVLEQATAEFAQQAVVEAGIGQVEREQALVHLADGGRDGPNPELLCDDPLNADRFRASSRQHPVQHRHADGSFGLLGGEAAGSQPGSDQRLVATHCRFY